MTAYIECPICGTDVPAGGGGHDMLFINCRICGGYKISWPAKADLVDRRDRSNIHLLSAATRRASDGGHHLSLIGEDIDRLLASTSPLRTPFDVLDALLTDVHRRTEDLTSAIKIPFTDYPLFSLRGWEQMRDFANQCQKLGHLEILNLDDKGIECKLSLDGWQKVDDIRREGRSSSQAFVAMWFDESMDAVFEEGIKPAVEDAGWNALRIDQKEHNDRIDDRIIGELKRSGLLVADFTGQRAGVYFEAGLAQGLGIPVVWTVRKDHLEDVHLDTRQYNHVVWESPEELREKLAFRLLATVTPPVPGTSE